MNKAPPFRGLNIKIPIFKVYEVEGGCLSHVWVSMTGLPDKVKHTKISCRVRPQQYCLRIFSTR